MIDAEKEFFEISAVARLTGISPHVLRVWERRYDVVSPERSETKRRQYSQTDIQRLSLLKTLVDNGHSIGTIADLSMAQLEERVSNVLEKRISDDELEDFAPVGVCRICVVGTILKEAVREAADASPALGVVAEFRALSEIGPALRRGAAELLVIERDSLFPEDIEEIQSALETHGMRRAIVVYRFAKDSVVDPLDIKQITALRAPVDASEIQLACIADIQLALRSGRMEHASVLHGDFTADPGEQIPPRAFSKEQLVRIGKISSVVQCECPKHLAGILTSLAAFEDYSAQCESRNPEDAEMHAFLHRATATCRSQMEHALSRLMEEEGISI